MNLDREKIRQAFQEWFMAFVVLWLPLLLGFMSGFQIGDGKDKVTVFPNLAAVKGFMVATLAAAGLSFLKAVWWYVTGTKVDPPASG